MKRVGCRVITFVAIFALVMLVPFVLSGPAGAAEQKVIKIGSVVRAFCKSPDLAADMMRRNPTGYGYGRGAFNERLSSE